MLGWFDELQEAEGCFLFHHDSSDVNLTLVLNSSMFHHGIEMSWKKKWKGFLSCGSQVSIPRQHVCFNTINGLVTWMIYDAPILGNIHMIHMYSYIIIYIYIYVDIVLQIHIYTIIRLYSSTMDCIVVSYGKTMDSASARVARAGPMNRERCRWTDPLRIPGVGGVAKTTMVVHGHIWWVLNMAIIVNGYCNNDDCG